MTTPPKKRVIRRGPSKPIVTKAGVGPIVQDRDADIGKAPPPVAAAEVPADGPRPLVRPSLDEESLAKLARLIVGKKPAPDWMLRGLRNAVAAVRWAGHEEDEHPRREVTRKDFQDTLEAASQIRRKLESPTFTRTLIAIAGDDLGGDQQAFQGLQSLIPRLERALAAIPSGRSRHKYAPGTNKPRNVCALCVAAAWRSARGRLPPHTSSKAHQACYQLWLLSGGPKTWGEEPGGWREQLKSANAELERGPHHATRLFDAPTS
jgi:hypothetical protein